MEGEAVNKKCIESLIKAGVFDGFEQTRSTLMASFESIIDSISDGSKKSLKGQITMFDLGGSEEDEKEMEKMKYTYTTLKEYSEKELLSMEKEMLGLYITGHPLEEIRDEIEKQSNINSMQVREAGEAIQNNEKSEFRDGQNVKFAGIIDSVKKKYTKTNKIMAFITIEDLYGSIEVIVFENCYQSCSNILMEDRVVLVEGRLSIREDDEPKIVASTIKEFGAITKNKALIINITNLDNKQKAKLRGALKTYIKRLEQLEQIADSFEGVEKSFAIQAGREIRIVVKPEKVNDAEMTLMARDIAKKVEDEMEYPGQIKVNIIREIRVVEYAK